MKSPTAPIQELDSRTWEELEVVEHPGDGTLLFKDKIRKRSKSGKLEEVPVRVRIVRPMQIVQARAECRVWFASIKGLDPDRDKDTFDNLEQLCIMAHAIREDVAPYGQLCTAEELASGYDEGSIWDLKGRIEVLRLLMDPRESELGHDEVWGKIFEVAKKRNLGPLATIAGHEQSSFVTFMASQALNSPTGAAWLRSLGTSNQEQSNPLNFSEYSPEAV
jgi:hypothetical protein